MALAPTVTRAAPDLDRARVALSEGRYRAARKLLSALLSAPGAKPAGARLLHARLSFSTGDYVTARDAARKLAGAATLAPKLRRRARTLAGEAAWALGGWDEAEKLLRPVASDPEGHRARILLARLLLERGDRRGAAPHLAALIADYNNEVIGADDASALAYVAMAARELHSYHDANDAFAMSARQNPRRTETQLEWASLFLEKGDVAQARECVQVALKYNPNHPLARTLSARLMLEHGADFSGADKELQRALNVNPNLAAAHITRAGMALREMDIPSADRHLDAALAINARDLEALSLRVAVRFLADDPAGQAVAEAAVLKLNPRFSRMYSIVARHAEWEHRYDELVEMARRALALDPEDPQAHATLALNLLRTGREQEGRRALSEAWNRDRFNVRVYNMLNLFEDVIEPEYVRMDAPPFRLRVHRDERDVLEPYLPPMLQQAHASMVKRYGFTPEGPIDIELFSEREHFAVRTTGLPSAGVQGVCFGKLITALSPAAGSFNWGQIVWHELSHVFHLQLSGNHVPRWFTEGLAEYETVIARPEWRREDDHNVWLARRRGAVPRLSQLNSAFTHARSPEALMTAYYTATLAVTYLIERFGFERVSPMLSAWGEGLRTPAVFARVLEVDQAHVDAGFERYLDRRLSKYDADFYVDLREYKDLFALRKRAEASPRDPDAQAALALAHLRLRETKPAAAAARAALKLSPHHPQAHFALALVALSRDQLPRAYGCLRAIVEHGRDGYELRLMLSQAARDLGKHELAAEHVLKAAERDPNREEAWQALVELSELTKRRDLAERALRALVRIDQHGRIPHMALLSILARRGAWREVVPLGERTLYLHPASAELHRILGDAYRHTGEPALALPKYEQALRLHHLRPGEVHLARARVLLALAQRDKAREALAQAVLADPDLKAEADRIGAGVPARPPGPKRTRRRR